MPQMSGDQLALLLHRTFPDIPVIMITGFGQLMEATGELPLGVALVIDNPVTQQTLRRAIATVMSRMPATCYSAPIVTEFHTNPPTFLYRGHKVAELLPVPSRPVARTM